MRRQLIKRMEEFLECRLAEDHPRGRLIQHVERPSVTISREAGTRGLEIGASLIDYLGQFDETAEHGWALFDQSLLARVIGEHRLPDSLSSGSPAADEPPPADRTLFQHSADAIRRLCRLGNVIVLGRGANYVTQDLANTFHVRLVSPRASRIAGVVSSLGLPTEESAAWVDATDKARAAYVLGHFGARVDDPAAYHLTINTGRLADAQTVRLIGDALLDWICSRDLTAAA